MTDTMVSVNMVALTLLTYILYLLDGPYNIEAGTLS